MSSSFLNLDIKNLKVPQWLSFRGLGTESLFGLKAKYPPVAIELGPTHMSLARLLKSKEKKWLLTSHDLLDVPAGLLDCEVFKLRINAPDQYQDLITSAVAKEGVKTKAISLVLPDHLARVALLPFETMPRSRRELVELVRWRMKKAVPFKVESSAVDFQVLPPNGEGPTTVLAVLMPGVIVNEHESLFRQQGIHAGLVDISSFSLVHLYQRVIDEDVPRDGDFLLLNVTSDFFAVLIFRAGRIVLYRCKSFTFEGPRDAGAEHRLLKRELQASLVYYMEKLGGKELARVYLRVVGHDVENVASIFENIPVGSAPELIDPGRIIDVTGRVTASGEDRSTAILQRLAPAIGAALGRNGREG